MNPIEEIMLPSWILGEDGSVFCCKAFDIAQ